MIEIWNEIELHPNIQVVLKICTILLATVLAIKIINSVSKRKEAHNHLYKTFMLNMIKAVVYIAGLLIAVAQIPGLNQVVQTILAGSGILALAISLSAQESLSNIINGLFITMFKPFEIGDRVRLVNNDITGTIEDITLRHTVIKTFINSRIVVPNSTINKEIIENSNLFDRKASSFVDIIIPYSADMHKAMEIMSKVIGNHPLYVDVRTDEDIENNKPKVKVYLRELGLNGVVLRANMWTNTVSENFEACSDARLQVKEELEEAGIQLAYTTFKVVGEHKAEKLTGDIRDEKE